MSVLSDFSRAFREFSQKPELTRIEPVHRRAFTVYHILERQDALKTFTLGLPFYDRPENTLYVTIKPFLNASSEDCIFLTRDDLNNMQISFDQLRGREIDEPYKSFNARLEELVDQAFRHIKSYEKTVDWLQVRDGESQIHTERDKKPLLLSRSTL